jgi:hypothetical protein
LFARDHDTLRPAQEIFCHGHSLKLKDGKRGYTFLPPVTQSIRTDRLF